jgi:ferredoxin
VRGEARSLPWPLLWLLATAFRFVPWPVRPGLRAIGDPGPDSPVLLTGNYALTVARVQRAVRELDVWLLVAASGGVNVWCAACGGHLTTHDVISALKTAGVSDRVRHRRVILPQLAATGIEADRVHERTGWKAEWGSADARDLPAFLRGEDVAGMHRVRFELGSRLEMAIMWAVPLSLLAAVILPFWPAGFLPLAGLIWFLALAVYLAFPLYERLVARGSLVAVLALLGSVALAGVAFVALAASRLTAGYLARWGGAALGIVVLLAFDLAGSTPLVKSWTHADRRHRVVLDPERCVACGRCVLVCPRGVMAMTEVAVLVRPDLCERCGACIVQCPADALWFAAADGAIVAPDAVRRFKLNLLGRRTGS